GLASGVALAEGVVGWAGVTGVVVAGVPISGGEPEAWDALCGKSTDETEPPKSAGRADPSCDSAGALDDPVAAAGFAADTCPFDCPGAPAPAPASAPRACVSEVRTAASLPSSKVSTGCAGIVRSRSASARSEPESATSSV